MSFFDKFKKKPEWLREVNAFLKSQANAQNEIDNNQFEDACYLTFVKGNNNKLYSIGVKNNADSNTVNVFVCKYKFDDIAKLKEIAMEISDNEIKAKKGIETSGYTSAEQIIIEIGETTIKENELSGFLNEIVTGTAIVESRYYGNADVNTLSDDAHLTASDLIKMKSGERTIIDNYLGYSLIAENNPKTNAEKINLIIKQNDFPIGGMFIEKQDILNTLQEIASGVLTISRSTTFLQLKKTFALSQIASFNKYERIVWKVQDGFEKNEPFEYSSDVYDINIIADQDGYELEVKFSEKADSSKVPEAFKGFELVYDISDSFDFGKLAQTLQSIEDETINIPSMKVLSKIDEIKTDRFNRRDVMNNIHSITGNVMGSLTLHELNVILGNLYNVKPYVNEFKQLEKERKNEIEKSNTKG